MALVVILIFRTSRYSIRSIQYAQITEYLSECRVCERATCNMQTRSPYTAYGCIYFWLSDIQKQREHSRLKRKASLACPETSNSGSINGASISPKKHSECVYFIHSLKKMYCVCVWRMTHSAFIRIILLTILLLRKNSDILCIRNWICNKHTCNRCSSHLKV